MNHAGPNGVCEAVLVTILTQQPTHELIRKCLRECLTGTPDRFRTHTRRIARITSH